MFVTLRYPCTKLPPSQDRYLSRRNYHVFTLPSCKFVGRLCTTDDALSVSSLFSPVPEIKVSHKKDCLPLSGTHVKCSHYSLSTCRILLLSCHTTIFVTD